MPHFFSTAARALNTSGDVRVILAEGPALWFLFICFRNHPRRESERSQGQKLPGFGSSTVPGVGWLCGCWLEAKKTSP